MVIAIFIAYNAARTLESFYRDFPRHLVDKIILVDDASSDGTFALATSLGIEAYQNPGNLGYGGNVKKAVALGLAQGGDVFIDIHPDGEYRPSAIPAALQQVAEGAEFVLGNRFAGSDTPLQRGMYLWKFAPLRVLNALHRLLLGADIRDFHQGFRVYTRGLLQKVNFERNSNGYLFSFELIAQAIFQKARIAQVPVQTSYTGKKRGASLKSSVGYSIGTFKVVLLYGLAKLGLPVRLFQHPKAVRASESMQVL